MSEVAKPVVSVRLMAYNHAPYINDAMESILMQHTSFLVEVIVGDDYSTDNTLEIIKKYTDEEKIKIRILDRMIGDDYWRLRQKNGRLFNFIDILKNCRGKYIAVLDGDDFWTDPLKLQKQVDFLEANPNFSICGTNYIVSNSIEDRATELRLTPFSLQEYFANNFLGTCTVMLRRDALIIKDLEFLNKISYGDWVIWASVLRFGDGINLETISAKYRFNGSGVSSSMSVEQAFKKKIADRIIVLKHFDKKFHSSIKRKGYKMIYHHARKTIFLNPSSIRIVFTNLNLILRFIFA